jgi:hypothetical protein
LQGRNTSQAVDIQTISVPQGQAAREAQNGYNYKGIQQLKNQFK